MEEPRTVHALACSRRLSLNGGKVYYACRPGCIRVLDLDGPAAAEAATGAMRHHQGPTSLPARLPGAALPLGSSPLDSHSSQSPPPAWHTAEAADGSADSDAQAPPYAMAERTLLMIADSAQHTAVPPIRHLLPEGKVLLFALRHRLYAFSLTQSKILATFWHFGPADGSASHRTVTRASQASVASAAQASPDPESVADAELAAINSSATLYPDKPANIPAICSVSAAGSTIVVQYPRWVFLLQRQEFEARPMHVLRVIPLLSESTDVVHFGPLLLAVTPSASGRDSSLVTPSAESDGNAVLAPAETELAAQRHLHIYNTETLQLAQRLSLPASRAAILGVSAAFALQSTETDGYELFANTHAVLATSSTLVMVRTIRASEQVALLAHHGHYALAQHMCQQRLRRPRVLVEVSNTYACKLWQQVLQIAAVRLAPFITSKPRNKRKTLLAPHLF